MKIETKFDVRNDVYFLDNNKVRSGKIKVISIDVLDSTHINIEYQINMQGITVNRTENEIFDSKESLIKSL